MILRGVLSSFSVVGLLAFSCLAGEVQGSGRRSTRAGAKGSRGRPVQLKQQKQHPTTPSPSSQPHIIFILSDDQGYRDVGYHGSEIKTPTLDRLAAQGVKLESYYVQPICSPSRSQFMTGKFREQILSFRNYRQV